jgi:hypothetical protein
MTLDDLRTGLAILKPGQMLSMSYAVYELIFPPGEPDELARTRAWALVEEYGCTIKNLPSEKRVCFSNQNCPQVRNPRDREHGFQTIVRLIPRDHERPSGHAVVGGGRLCYRSRCFRVDLGNVG